MEDRVRHDQLAGVTTVHPPVVDYDALTPQRAGPCLVRAEGVP